MNYEWNYGQSHYWNQERINAKWDNIEMRANGAHYGQNSYIQQRINQENQNIENDRVNINIENNYYSPEQRQAFRER
jgi:hypothetical protein